MGAQTDDGKLLLDLLSVLPRKLGAVDRLIVSTYLKDSRIRPHHLGFLKAISVSDGLSQKELTESLCIDKSFVSVTVRELMDMDLILNDSNRKIHSIRLTDTGKDMVVMSRMLEDILSDRLLSSLSSDECETLVVITRKLIARCDEIMQKGRFSFLLNY